MWLIVPVNSARLGKDASMEKCKVTECKDNDHLIIEFGKGTICKHKSTERALYVCRQEIMH